MQNSLKRLWSNWIQQHFFATMHPENWKIRKLKTDSIFTHGGEDENDLLELFLLNEAISIIVDDAEDILHFLGTFLCQTT